MKSKKRMFFHYFFLSLICFWAFMINVLFFLIFIDAYKEWLVTYGMFFLPWLITLWFVWILLYVFKFRNPTLKDLKKLNSEVYHNDNMTEDDNSKISKNIATAIINQREVIFQREKEEIKHHKQIADIRNEAIKETLDKFSNKN